MHWNQLLCEKRYRSYDPAKKPDLRNEFQKDYHRIICSASFRRLQDKTQVFPLEQNDFVRTRLTHSLEVASFAKSLGQMAFQYIIEHQLDPQVDGDVKEKVCSILECAGLLHDIGNPPFGHFGEDSIRNWFREHLGELTYQGTPLCDLLDVQMQNDLCHFEGNAQALRLLCKLHYLIDENGMHLTYALLNTLIKYPVSSCETDKHAADIKYHKMGYYLAEADNFRDITESTGAVGCRYPLTYLLEAADDIAYLTADLEDAVKKNVIFYEKLLRELKARSDGDAEYDKLIGWLEEKYQTAVEKGFSDPEMNAVQNWVIAVQSMMLRAASDAFTSNYSAIMNGTMERELLAVSLQSKMHRALAEIERQYIYNAKHILMLDVTAGNILGTLMDHYVPAAIRFDTDEKLSPMEEKLMQLVSDNYLSIYRIYAKGQNDTFRLYLRLLLVTDFICGMTDSYAKRMYQQFRGIL